MIISILYIWWYNFQCHQDHWDDLNLPLVWLHIANHFNNAKMFVLWCHPKMSKEIKWISTILLEKRCSTNTAMHQQATVVFESMAEDPAGNSKGTPMAFWVSTRPQKTPWAGWTTPGVCRVCRTAGWNCFAHRTPGPLRESFHKRPPWNMPSWWPVVGSQTFNLDDLDGCLSEYVGKMFRKAKIYVL